MSKFKQLRTKVRCYNCGYNVPLTVDTVKEKTFSGMRLLVEVVDLTATYVECPVCGERILKQLDVPETLEAAQIAVKYDSFHRAGKKLSKAQNQQWKMVEILLNKVRSQLNKTFWDEINQSLNQYEQKTEMADQEPTLGE